MPHGKPASVAKLFLGLIVAAWCLWGAPAQALEAIGTPILLSAPNFRDLAGIAARFGGTGFVNTTSNSGVMRTGFFFRTDELGSLSSADSARIVALRVGRDIDLRTPSEINSSPDRTPPGVLWTNVNIYGTPSPVPEPPFTAAPSVAVNFMETGYREFITDPVQRAGFRTVLLTLAHDKFPVMYHCAGGKDRTGWTSALLQSIAGVPREIIQRDYLATNSYTAALIDLTRAAIIAGDPAANPATMDALLGVLASYLQTGFDQLAASYGTMQAYLTQGLGLTQADIYVLRAKMVYYTILPGQNGFTGNAAAGASFLRALQNSPLSGSYTTFNYYLQSAVDTGSLGGVQATAGGQVHADAASFLVRQPQRLDAALRPFTSGQGLPEGQTRVWMAGLGGVSGTDGRQGFAASRDFSTGTILGATRRYGSRASASAGLGYNYGSVKSDDGKVTTNTVLATLGGRYGLAALAYGTFLEGRADLGWVDYRSGRELGAGLGNASGRTGGALYSAQASLGHALGLAPFTLSPRLGARFTGLYLPGFGESGSDLALDMQDMNKWFASLLAGLEARMEAWHWGSWSLTPAATLGYERALGSAQIESTGGISGIMVSQQSAYDSRGLLSAGLALTVERGGLTFSGMIDGVVGDDARSSGLGGQLTIGFLF